MADDSEIAADRIELLRDPGRVALREGRSHDALLYLMEAETTARKLPQKPDGSNTKAVA
jgi:hypothetical protein